MKKKENMIILIVICLLLALVIGILVSLFDGMKSSSIAIDVKEEISLPISVVVECQGETIVIYESASIASTEAEFTPYSIRAEGSIWLMIDDKKYEILSFIDHADSPIVEIKGDATSLEVLAYTTLFQTTEETYQSTTITIE